MRDVNTLLIAAPSISSYNVVGLGFLPARGHRFPSSLEEVKLARLITYLFSCLIMTLTCLAKVSLEISSEPRTLALWPSMDLVYKPPRSIDPTQRYILRLNSNMCLRKTQDPLPVFGTQAMDSQRCSSDSGLVWSNCGIFFHFSLLNRSLDHMVSWPMVLLNFSLFLVGGSPHLPLWHPSTSECASHTFYFHGLLEVEPSFRRILVMVGT